MKIDLDENRGQFAIAAYDRGWVRIGDVRVDEPCLISPQGIETGRLPPAVADLATTHFDLVIDLAPEIVLLGTGPRQIFVDHAIITHLAAAGIALETMDTGAACRSFNILLAESRPVVAALYMI